MAADIVTDGDTSHAACPHDHSFAGGEARTSHLEVPLGKSQSAISDHTWVLTQTGLTAGRSARQVDLVVRRVRPASPPSGRCPAARRRPQRVFGQVTMLRWRRTSCGPGSGSASAGTSGSGGMWTRSIFTAHASAGSSVMSS
jgi:hypothetical protein